MGRHNDPADRGSRRAVVLTLVASALLVLGGVAVLRSAGDLRLGHAGPTGRTGQATPSATSTIGETEEPDPASATPTPTAASTPATPTPDASTWPATSSPPTPRDDVARAVVTIVNAERARAGCAPVTSHAALTRAAQDHSEDMAARGYFSHTSPDGRTFGQRIRAAGWAGGAVAENIAAGQASAAAVMKDWMGSGGHRANILDCTYRTIGVGYATGGRYGTYWTQAFGA
jgi:uncharacterized protein YkwD